MSRNTASCWKRRSKAFSSEVDSGSRKENASERKVAVLLNLAAVGWRDSPLDPLEGPGKCEQRALTGFQQAAQKNHRAAGAHDFTGAFDQFALACGIEKFAGE